MKVTYLSDELKELVEQLQKIRTRLVLLELTTDTEEMGLYEHQCPTCKGTGRKDT